MMFMIFYSCRFYNFQIRDKNQTRVYCVNPIHNYCCMAHTLIQIESYLFLINQPKVSFQFLIFKDSSYTVFTLKYHYVYPVSHFETANGSHYL